MAKPDLKAISAELDDIWKKFDTLYAGISEEGWKKRFGKDWIFADQPFHMGYLEEMVASNVTAGKSLPADKQVMTKTLAELNQWNATEFAKRPAGLTAQQAWDQWKQNRDAVRKAMSGLSDADLDRPAWMPIFMGWATVRDLLAFSVVHAVGEYTELRFRLKKKEPQPSAAGKNLRLATMMDAMGLLMNKKSRRTLISWRCGTSRAKAAEPGPRA